MLATGYYNRPVIGSHNKPINLKTYYPKITKTVTKWCLTNHKLIQPITINIL
jgi:hypothetical protein